MVRFATLMIGTFVVGCSSADNVNWPELHAVSGTLTRNGQPVTGGVLRMEPIESNGDLIVTAVVGPDGRFTLSTSHSRDKSGARKAGAPSGSYRVSLTPNLGDQTQTKPGDISPIRMKEPVTIRDASDALNLKLP